jgi:gamma-glutamyl-gamma-aminobutyrate hydrolase PuuD
LRDAHRPLIGISASLHDFGDYGRVGVQCPLLAAGGLPLGLPQLAAAIGPSLDRLDAIVLAPGRDIEPARYGQEPDPLLAATEPRRDAFELELVGVALERGMPILGICRGIQVLNVALGGTLLQDLRLDAASAEHPSDPGWARWREVESSSLAEREPPAHPRHAIAVTPGSLLGRRSVRPKSRSAPSITRRSTAWGTASRSSPAPPTGSPSDRAQGTPGARRPVGAAGGMAHRPAVPQYLRVVRRGRRGRCMIRCAARKGIA